MKKRIQAKIRAKKINKRFESGFIILGHGKKINYKKKNLKNRCVIIQESLKEFLNNSNREKDVFIIDFTPSEKSQSIKIEPQNIQ